MTHTPHAYSSREDMARIRRRWAREAAWGYCKLLAGAGLILFVLALLTVPHGG